MPHPMAWMGAVHADRSEAEVGHHGRTNDRWRYSKDDEHAVCARDHVFDDDEAGTMSADTVFSRSISGPGAVQTASFAPGGETALRKGEATAATGLTLPPKDTGPAPTLQRQFEKIPTSFLGTGVALAPARIDADS